MQTLYTTIQTYRSAVFLERMMSRKRMTLVRHILFILTIILLGVSGALYVTVSESIYVSTGLGGGLILLGFYIEQILIFTYHNTFYFKGLHSVLGIETKRVTGCTYEVAQALLKHPDDLLQGFCLHPLGNMTLIRTGLTPDDIATYISSERTLLKSREIIVEDGTVYTLATLGQYLIANDVSLQNLLREKGIMEKTFIGSLQWVTDAYHNEKRITRWWSHDNLSKRQALGTELTYGKTFQLNRFTKNIRTTAVFSTLTQNSAYAVEKVTEIESVLAQAKASNVLLVGQAGVGKIDLVIAVATRMRQGTSLDSVRGQHIHVLDTSRLFSVCDTKQELERALISLFTESNNAGNIVIVIENISTFIEEAKALDVHVTEILDPFLASPALHIIATDTPAAYHNNVQAFGQFMRRFEEILIEPSDLSSTIRVLQSVAFAQEYRYGILFTYAGLEAISSSADRYIVEGVMPDKAVKLLIEVAAHAQQTQKYLIDADFVYKTVSEKTNIPAGPVREEERDQLMHLEEILHGRIVGQNRAVNAIARTMRRARAGVVTNDKPLGSFLFLGPTGVGKTETAKALAFVFFGDEKNMQRLDMSEFSGDDAVAQLIGDGTSSGALSNMLQEHPYTVLLLDEFEKASEAIHDVFLQILDEGVFTDARGIKINARNTIIIATSNAGSPEILKAVQNGADFALITDDIINTIIESGAYKPELINRFGSTIVFEPLTKEQQKNITGLMIRDLTRRIEERGYQLTISDDLLDVLVEKGFSPEFGARPMQRVLQDVIEEKIAQQIISGAVTKGQTIILTKASFTEAELAV